MNNENLDQAIPITTDDMLRMIGEQAITIKKQNELITGLYRKINELSPKKEKKEEKKSG